MSITYQAQVPIATSTGAATGAVPVDSFTPSAHCNEGDIVVLSAGEIAPATTNVASGIAGIAQHDSNANWGGQNPANAFVLNEVLGYSQVGGLMPISPSQTLVATVGPPVVVEINLNSTTGWVTGGAQQANIGTAVGLSTQTVNGVPIYVADPTQSNKVANIVGKVNGPFAAFGADQGNLGVRVLISFYQSVLAVTG